MVTDVEIIRPHHRIYRSDISEEERVLSGVLRHVREAAENAQTVPGEHWLAERLGCSRQQVRHALAQLERQSIVIRRQGAATTVDPLALRLSARFDALAEYGEVLERMGYTPSIDVLEASLIRMPEDVGPLLTRNASDTAARIVLRWFADDDPIMLSQYTLAIPRDVDAVTIDAGRPVFSIMRTLWGEHVAWEVVTAGVDSLTPERAEDLHLEPGGISKLWQVVGVAASGERVYHALQHHHPNRVLYSFVRSIREPWSVPQR